MNTPDTLRKSYQCCSELCKRSGKDRQRHLRLCCQMTQIVSNTTTPKLNMELKNVNTVRKMNMADTRVEDIESDSDSSSFDNDDYSDDSDNNHYQKIARDIFGDSDSEDNDGDSDSEDNEVFEGFPILMPENVKLDSQESNLSGREQDDLYVHDQPRQGLTVNMEGNTRPINVFH